MKSEVGLVQATWFDGKAAEGRRGSTVVSRRCCIGSPAVVRDNDAGRVRRPAEIPYVVHLGTFQSGGVGNVLIADTELVVLGGSAGFGSCNGL